MKTLKESILSSTKTGKQEIFEKWCKDNLYCEYEIKNSVLKANNFMDYLHFKDYADKDFSLPNGLYLGNITTLVVSNLFNNLKENQIKGEIDEICVFSRKHVNTIDNKETIKLLHTFKIESSYSDCIKEIKNLNLEFTNKNPKKINVIDIKNNRYFKKQDVMNIKAENVDELVLYATGACDELQKDIKPLKGEKQITEYLDNFTKNLKGLRTIKIYNTSYYDYRYYKNDDGNWILLR
jgi:hypothetical protein